MKSSPSFLILGLAAILGVNHAGATLTPDKQVGWHYTLLEGSTLVDDCPICGRPDIIVPMQGSFTLRWVDENPLFSTYALDEISFTASAGTGLKYSVTGSGTLRIGGEVAITQEMAMQVRIDNGFGKVDALLASVSGPPERLWPMIQITLRQTNGTFTQVYDLTLAAAPFREAWFSTTGDFTSSTRPMNDNHVGGGDLLSSTGRIVRRNQELTSRLGVMPVVPDLGLDAVDVLPGGEIAFSIQQNVFSETLGNLQAGDLLSDRGRVISTNQALLGAFDIQAPAADAGLDAVHIFDNSAASAGDIWFSIVKDQFSRTLGRTLHHGDILSSRGHVVRTNQELLKNFQPIDPATDHGLDAFYVWVSGEIWFSTETGFVGSGSIGYLGGDVLSDQGYVVFRNLALLNPFAPIEDRLEFGLDALWIVTDTTPPPASLKITSVRSNAATGSIALEWRGGGRVFQVERALDLTGPWQTLSPIVPDQAYEDLGVLLQQARAFYRIRQW